jgi:protein-tyrosine kinase
VIAECLRDYEYTIVDTPAANRSADARRLAGIVGYGLIVARRNLSYLDDVATLASELAEDRANVIATLFNDA